MKNYSCRKCRRHDVAFICEEKDDRVFIRCTNCSDEKMFRLPMQPIAVLPRLTCDDCGHEHFQMFKGVELFPRALYIHRAIVTYECSGCGGMTARVGRVSMGLNLEDFNHVEYRVRVM